jgi:XTP/dITP diphosphohydrolase
MLEDVEDRMSKWPRELLLATNNQHKIAELRELLRGLRDVQLRAPAELGITLDVPEDAPTYAGNAAAKALAFARAAGLVALADDSGLEVDALGGEPGVRSARYAGPGASNADRIALILDRLRGVPIGRRGARFVSVIAVATPDGEVRTVEGECHGYIAESPSGQAGFGYDPVFFLPEQGRTMADLTDAEKNEISHRGRAARRAVATIEAALD